MSVNGKAVSLFACPWGKPYSYHTQNIYTLQYQVWTLFELEGIDIAFDIDIDIQHQA